MPTVTRTKVAVLRRAGFPIGEPAPCYLNCPCGAEPATVLPLHVSARVHCACGATYTADGWAVKES